MFNGNEIIVARPGNDNDDDDNDYNDDENYERDENDGIVSFKRDCQLQWRPDHY